MWQSGLAENWQLKFVGALVCATKQPIKTVAVNKNLNMKIKIFLAVGAIGLASMASYGQNISWSATAPTISGYDVGSLTGVTADANNVNSGADDGTYVAGNRQWLGQTFTTGASGSGFSLNSITLQQVQYTTDTTYWSVDTGWNGFQNWNLSVGTISGGVFTPTILNQAYFTFDATGNPGGNMSGTGTGLYLTFNLALPLTLADNTQYAFVIAAPENGGYAPYMEMNGTSSDVYAGGAAFTVDQGDSTTVYSATGDHVFAVSLTAAPVPEPSTLALAGMGGLGMLALLRRRK